MANLLPKLFSVNLTDPESNRSYTISVTADEAKRLERDVAFATLKLEEAKNLEYAELISEQDVEMVEALDPGLNFDEIVDDSPKSTNEDSVFKWPHEAILMLLDEYRKQQSDLTSGKISQKKVWLKISDQLRAHGHNVTGPQCQSKFSGMKKTYKKIKDYNNKSCNSAKHWPYLTLMDDLMGDKPFISPLATCSSTGKKKRTLSECSNESSTSSDADNFTIQKKPKITPTHQLIASLEERSLKSEENKERRFKEFMAFKAQKTEEALQYKTRALDLLEKLINSKNSS